MTWEILYESDCIDCPKFSSDCPSCSLCKYPSECFEADSYLSAVAQFYECFPGHTIHSVWVKVC